MGDDEQAFLIDEILERWVSKHLTISISSIEEPARSCLNNIVHEGLNRPSHIMLDIYKTLVRSIWEQDLTSEEIKSRLKQAVHFSHQAMSIYRERGEIIGGKE